MNFRNSINKDLEEARKIVNETKNYWILDPNFLEKLIVDRFGQLFYNTYRDEIFYMKKSVIY